MVKMGSNLWKLDGNGWFGMDNAQNGIDDSGVARIVGDFQVDGNSKVLFWMMLKEQRHIYGGIAAANVGNSAP